MLHLGAGFVRPKVKNMSAHMVGSWLLLAVAYINIAECTRITFGEAHGEPNGDQIINNHGYVFAEERLFKMQSAGFDMSKLNHNVMAHYKSDEFDPNVGSYRKEAFEFDSLEALRKAASLNWYIPLEEKTALHQYDDEQDIELARGPRVDQTLCKVHLDYMVYMMRTYLQPNYQAKEFSIFNIMLSNDSPRRGIHMGASTFAGDYSTCTRTSLAVMRRDLSLLTNSTFVNEYYNNYADPQLRAEINSNRVARFLAPLGPLVGRRYEPEVVDSSLKLGLLHELPMRYCMARTRHPNWPNTTYHKRNTNLKSAICLPETCDSSSLHLYKDQIEQLFNFQAVGKHKFFSGLYMDHLYCLPDEQSELRNPLKYASTVLLIVFLTTWFCLTLIASAYNDGDDGDCRRILRCWNIRHNLSEFVGSARRPQSRSQIAERKRVTSSPLNGFKVISSSTVIGSHAIMVIFDTCWNSKRTHNLLSNSIMTPLMLIYPAVVDNFFVITSVITVRLLLKLDRASRAKQAPDGGGQQMQVDLRDSTFWLKFLALRYLRIVPLYVLVHWFLLAGFRFLGAGPYWDYGTSATSWQTNCQQESWWTVLLPSANLKSPSRHCNGVAWYLGNDMQFALLTPFIMSLYLYSRRLGHTIMACSAVAVMANHVRYYYLHDSNPQATFWWSVTSLSAVTDGTPEGYVLPQYRVVANLVGIAAGQLLDQYETGEIRRWPRWFVKYGRIIVFVAAYCAFAGPYAVSLMPLDDAHRTRAAAALLNGTLHGLTAMVTSVFVLLLCTHQLPTMSAILGAPIFKPLADASLSTVLVHIPLLYYHSRSMHDLSLLSLEYYFTIVLVRQIEAYTLSAIVYCLFEQPIKRLIDELVKTLAGNHAKRAQKPKIM